MMFLLSSHDSYFFILFFLDEQLKTWMHSVRSRLGRVLEDQASGSAAKIPTDRQKYILEKFGFLRDHIAKKKTKSSGKVCENVKFQVQ